MARLEGVLGPAAKEFVLLRITRMRGVDLDLFDFDYDLTWMGFFLNADEEIYGRYGGRDAESPDSKVSLAGLRFAMNAALTVHKKCSPRSFASRPAGKTVEQFRSIQELRPTACVHCHQVYDLRRQDLQATGAWRRENLWVYPLPENVGLTLDVNRGNRIAQVAANSPAARLGLHADDRLVRVNNLVVHSFADLQYALHRAPPVGRIAFVWDRDGKRRLGTLAVAEGWRKTDLSWRWSLRGVGPTPAVQGEDLTAEEKRALGLSERRVAFRQGNFVSTQARQAGIRQNDVILGVDGKELEMTARQLGAFIRLNYKIGDRVVFNIARGSQRIDLPMHLPGKE